MGSGLAWHRALVRGLAGVDEPSLAEQEAPDPHAVVAWLRDHDLVDTVRDRAARARAAHEIWPAPPPAGWPAAQYLAAVQRIREELDLLGVVSSASPVAPRGMDAEERRLRADIPPHHGSG